MYYDIVISDFGQQGTAPGRRRAVIDPAHPIRNTPLRPIRSGLPQDPHARTARPHPSDPARRNPGSTPAHRVDHRAHAAGPPRARARLPRHPPQAREPAADQRLQAARRGQCRGHAVGVRAQARRLDDQRRQRRPGRRLCGATGGRAVHGRRRSRPRRRRRSSGCGRSARGSCRCPYDVAWKALEDRAYPGVEGTFMHPFDDHDFIAGHAHDGSRDPRGRARHRRRDRRHRRRRAHHRRRQRDQGARSRRSRSGAPSRKRPRPPRSRSRRDRRRCSRTGRRRSSTAPAARASFPRMWERMQPVVDGYIVVSLDETQARDAPDGGKGARHRRRRGRAGASPPR